MSMRWNLIVKPVLDKGLVGRWGLFIEPGRCQMPVLWRGRGLLGKGDLCARKKEPGWPQVLDHLSLPQCLWAHARETGRRLRVSSIPRTFRMSMGQIGTAAGYWAK